MVHLGWSTAHGGRGSDGCASGQLPQGNGRSPQEPEEDPNKQDYCLKLIRSQEYLCQGLPLPP